MNLRPLKICSRWITICLCLVSHSTHAYELQGRWSRTANNFNTGSLGTPITLTWGFVPEGTTIDGSEETSASDLLNFLDTLIGAGAGGADLTQHTWFPLFEDSYNRISQLSGLTFLYEPQDSGASINSTTPPQGSIGLQADLRIGGHSIDGQTGSNTLAYNYFPNHGDMVIDTDNTNFYSRTTNHYRALRNVIMHETGHGLGLNHINSNTARFLLEPSISTSYDGPQLDDILGLHRNYGDFWEKGDGNDIFSSPTQLGSLASGESLNIGTHGDSTVVTVNESDFISIDDNSDLDYFSFTVTEPLTVLLELIPRGTTYNVGPESGTQIAWNTQALSDLTLQLLDTNGSNLLDTANDHGVGLGESIRFALDPGSYLARVSGSANDVQLYGLSIFTALEGDLNGDHIVDGADAGILFANWGQQDSTLEEGNLNGDSIIDGADAGILFSNWTLFSNLSITAVPEPANLSMVLLALGGMLYQRTARHRQWGPSVYPFLINFPAASGRGITDL